MRLKMKNLAEQIFQLIGSQWFHVLISDRYQYNRMLKIATEEIIREALFDQDFFSTPVDVISMFNNFHLNRDFCREIEANMNKERKDGIDQFVLSQYDNTIDTPYQPLFYNNCAMWIESTKIKWQHDVDRDDLIKYFRVHSILLERNRI